MSKCFSTLWLYSSCPAWSRRDLSSCCFFLNHQWYSFDLPGRLFISEIIIPVSNHWMCQNMSRLSSANHKCPWMNINLLNVASWPISSSSPTRHPEVLFSHLPNQRPVAGITWKLVKDSAKKTVDWISIIKWMGIGGRELSLVNLSITVLLCINKKGMSNIPSRRENAKRVVPHRGARNRWIW